MSLRAYHGPTLTVRPQVGLRGIMTQPVTAAKLLEDLQTLVRDAEALLRATADQTGERIASVRARAEESLQQAKVRLADAQDTVLESVRDATQTTEKYVKQNPWQALGIAAGIGMLAGLLLRRRD